MRQYETCFIVNPQTDDATIERHVNAVRDLIQNNGGKILEEDRMGTRRLAYPIQKLTQGYYTAMIYEGSGELVQSLDSFLKLEEPYIRHLTIRWDNRKVVVRKKAEDEEDEAQAVSEQQVATTVAPRPHGSGRREEPSDIPEQPEADITEQPTAEAVAEQTPGEQPESDDTEKTE
jgi:small subunit ribosomal protein S6